MSFATASSNNVGATPVDSSELAATGAGQTRRVGPLVSIAIGAVILVGMLAFLLIGHEADGDLSVRTASLNCPAGSIEARNRVRVTAELLNVRGGPSPSAKRLADRTLRKGAAVTEECRTEGWSRVRLDDGRWGWVSNAYLALAAANGQPGS
jgi:uncharacterized protein YgiM (DUF1202 family)